LPSQEGILPAGSCRKARLDEKFLGHLRLRERKCGQSSLLKQEDHNGEPPLPVAPSASIQSGRDVSLYPKSRSVHRQLGEGEAASTEQVRDRAADAGQGRGATALGRRH
jgi:hypothetical protein